MHANVYKILVEEGDILTADTVLFVLEAMKMEMAIKASPHLEGLIVSSVLVLPGQVVKPGDNLALCKALRQLENESYRDSQETA